MRSWILHSFLKWSIGAVIFVQFIWAAYLFSVSILSPEKTAWGYGFLNEQWSAGTKVIAALLATLGYLQKKYPAPADYSGVTKILSSFQRDLFGDGAKHPRSRNRVTLFKFVPKNTILMGRSYLKWHQPNTGNLLKQGWAFLCAAGCNLCSILHLPYGRAKVLDGFLVAVARSREKIHGQIEPPLRIIYGVHCASDREVVEGAAGLAWAMPEQPVGIPKLPELTVGRILSDKKGDRDMVTEYAKQSKVSVQWLRRKALDARARGLLDSHVPVPQSLYAQIVLVKGQAWGVLVVDSSETELPISLAAFNGKLQKLVCPVLDVLLVEGG